MSDKSPWFTPMDTGSMPLTEPHPAPIFDTGPHPEPLDVWAFAATDTMERDSAEAMDVSGAVDIEAADIETGAGEPSEPLPVPVPPTVVPGQYLYIKWWKFVLVTLGVWAVSAAAGVGFYYWWFHALDKTWTNFAVLVWVIICMVAGPLLALVERRPLVSTAAIAVMTAPFATGLGAAALYGLYVFRWISA